MCAPCLFALLMGNEFDFSIRKLSAFTCWSLCWGLYTYFISFNSHISTIRALYLEPESSRFKS